MFSLNTINLNPCRPSSSAVLWKMIYVITLWQFLPRLCMLFCMFSHLGSILWLGHVGHAIQYVTTPWQYLPNAILYVSLGSICRGLACYSACDSVCYHALAVSAKAWHAAHKKGFLPSTSLFYRVISRIETSALPRAEVSVTQGWSLSSEFCDIIRVLVPLQGINP